MSVYTDYLWHHGILGQRWGKRNGPPYPLDGSDHSASEKKAGWRKSLDGGSGESSKKKFQLTDKQKKYLKIGAAVAAAGLVAYGGYKLHQSGALDNFVSSGQNKVGDILGPTDGKVGDIIKLPDKREPKKLSSDRIPKSVTDAFGNLTEDNPLRKADNVQENCTNVFLAFVGRKRGLDVTPGYQKDENGQFVGNHVDDIIECFKNRMDSMNNDVLKQSKGCFCDSYDKACEVIKKWCRCKEGDYGYLDGYFNQLGSIKHHAISWQVENGRIVFGDGINGTRANEYFSKIVLDRDVSMFNCTNLELDMDKFSTYVKF